MVMTQYQADPKHLKSCSYGLMQIHYGMLFMPSVLP